MIFLDGLKRICNICLYMTFASMVVYVFSGVHLILTLPIFVLVAFLSSYFTLEGNLRYVNAVPLLLIYWIVPLTFVNFLMITPAIAYLIWTFPKSDEDIKKFHYQGIFEVFFIILIIAFVMNILVIGSYTNNTIDLPRDTFLFATSFLLSSIVLVRLIRHDESVLGQTKFEKRIKTMVVCVMIGALLFTMVAFSDFADYIWPSSSIASNTENIATVESRNNYNTQAPGQENISLQELDGIFLLDLENLSLADLDELSLLDLGDLSLQDLNGQTLVDLRELSLQELDDLLLLLDLDEEVMKELSLLNLEDLSLEELEELFSLDLDDLSQQDPDSRSQSNQNNQSQLNPDNLSFPDLDGLSLLDINVLALLDLDHLSLHDLGDLAILNLDDLFLQNLRDQVVQTLEDLPLLDLSELPFPDLEGIPLLNIEELPFLDLENLSFRDLEQLPALIRENLSFLDLDNLLRLDIEEVFDSVIMPTLIGGSAVVGVGFVVFVPFIIASAVVTLIMSLTKFTNKPEPTVLKDEGFEEERISLDAMKKKKGLFKLKAENRVRSVYKRFLFAIKKKGLSIPPHLTSYDVQTLVAAQFESEKSGELRDEYIRVRYGELNYTKEDVERIKALYKEVKADIERS